MLSPAAVVRVRSFTWAATTRVPSSSSIPAHGSANGEQMHSWHDTACPDKAGQGIACTTCVALQPALKLCEDPEIPVAQKGIGQLPGDEDAQFAAG